MPNIEWKNPDIGQRKCPKHVEFLDKNIFGKISAFVGFFKKKFVTMHGDGFGGLVVSMLASGTQVCEFKPGRSRWIFLGVKILSMPSFGGEVKESVQCSSLAACQRT